MPEKLYDYANFIKLRLVISLYCSRQRTIMYAVEVQNGLYDTKRGPSTVFEIVYFFYKPFERVFAAVLFGGFIKTYFIPFAGDCENCFH